MTRMRNRENISGLFVAVVGLAVVLLAYGAIPFVTLPTLEQAAWTTGFAQSIANQSLLALTANNMGIPAPAPIAFGLAGAYPEAVLIFAGIAPQNAYTLICALWLTCAFAGAYCVAKKQDVSAPSSALLATTWLCLPIVSLHAGYAMLSIGIAMLPTYFFAFFALLESDTKNPRHRAWLIACVVAAAIVSIFLDGYTFVMFAIGSVIFMTNAWCAQRVRRNLITRLVFPGTALAFGTAYLAYKSYMQHEVFWIPPLSYFRAWGLDLSFLLIPAVNISWLLDTLHLSVVRTTDHWYGDASVWETTFLLPLLLLSIFTWIYLRPRSALLRAALVVALCGIYLSFGPSLKSWSERPSAQAQADDQFMPASSALFPTGSGILSEHVPGFSNMRASYRWIALGAFGLWLMLVLLHAHTRETRAGCWVVIATVVVILLNIPPPAHLRNAIAYRSMFLRVQHDLVAPMAAHIMHGDKIAAIPRDNDFMMSYAAAKAGVFAYNIGGDKNIALAARRWPTAMVEVPSQTLPPDFGERAYELLVGGFADEVLVPFYSEPQTSQIWPCVTLAPTAFLKREATPSGSDWACPGQLRHKYATTLSALESDYGLTVSNYPYFALIQLPPSLRNQASRQALLGKVLNAKFHYPIDLATAQPNIRWLLPTGWHAFDGAETWSSDHAQIQLPVPEHCHVTTCVATFQFQTFGAAQRHHVRVVFCANDREVATQSLLVKSSDPIEMHVALPRSKSLLTLDIVVDGASSPLERSGAPDGRVLGISIAKITLEQGS